MLQRTICVGMRNIPLLRGVIWFVERRRLISAFIFSFLPFSFLLFVFLIIFIFVVFIVVVVVERVAKDGSGLRRRRWRRIALSLLVDGRVDGMRQMRGVVVVVAESFARRLHLTVGQ